MLNHDVWVSCLSSLPAEGRLKEREERRRAKEEKEEKERRREEARKRREHQEWLKEFVRTFRPGLSSFYFL